MSRPTHETLLDQPGFRVDFHPAPATIILVDLSGHESEGGNVEISAALWPSVRRTIDRHVREWRADEKARTP